MSKKKKNIRRKKSNNLLKGMAAAGAVVGGGTIFAGNNAVYAAELGSESGSTENLDGIGSQSVSESVSESVRPTNSQVSNQAQGRNLARAENSFAQNTLGNNVATVSEDENTNDDGTVNAEVTNKAESESISKSASTSASTSASISASTSASTSVSTSASTSASTMYSDVDSKESLNVAVSESLSLSEAGAENTSGNPLDSASTSTYEGSLSDAINSFDLKYSQIQSNYDSQIAISKENNEYLTKLYGEITEQMAKVKEAYEYAYNNKTDKLNSDKYDYYKLVDDLAVMYAKYFLFQQENRKIDIIDKTDWEKDEGKNNYIKIDYYDANKNKQSAYFDYIITDKNNNKIDGEDKWYHNYKYDKVSIMVLKKSPKYVNGNNEFYFYDDYSTSIKGNRVFYINNQKLTMDSNQSSYIKEYTYIGNDQYKVSYVLNGKSYEHEFTMSTKTKYIWKDHHIVEKTIPNFADISNPQSPGYNGVKG